MIKKFIFLISFALTISTLIMFFINVHKIGTFNDFIRAREKISNAAALACGIEETLEGLTANENTAIIKMPSIGPAGSIMPGQYDYCVMIRSNNILMFSIMPAQGTSRKHRTLYYKDFPECAFNTSGNILEFTCTVRGKVFQHFSSFLPDILPVPEQGEEVFR